MYAFNGENLIFLSKFRRKNVENSILIVESCQFHLVCEILWKLSSMTGLQGVSLLRNRRPTPPPPPQNVQNVFETSWTKRSFIPGRSEGPNVCPSVSVLIDLLKEEISPFSLRVCYSSKWAADRYLWYKKFFLIITGFYFSLAPSFGPLTWEPMPLLLQRSVIKSFFKVLETSTAVLLFI